MIRIMISTKDFVLPVSEGVSQYGAVNGGMSVFIVGMMERRRAGQRRMDCIFGEDFVYHQFTIVIGIIDQF